MDHYRLNGYLSRERRRALRLKISHMWRSLPWFSPKQHSSCQDTSQSSNPQTSYNQQLPRLLSLPNSLSEPSPPTTREEGHADMLATPLVISTGYRQYPYQEPGQQARPMPPEVIPGTEIIIAVMGVTGNIQCLLKTCIHWLR